MPSKVIPFIGPSYQLESRPSGVQRTINLIPVPEEPGNERTGWVFRDLPGLEEFTTGGEFDPYFASVVYLHHYDNIVSPQTFVDVQGNTWIVTETAVNAIVQGNVAPNPKFGTGSMLATWGSVSAPFISHIYSPNIPLDGTGQNKFTLDGWFFWSHTANIGQPGRFNPVSNPTGIRVEYQSGLFLRGTLNSGFSIGGTVAPVQWNFYEGNYDGTTLRLFLNGVMIASTAMTPGPALTIASAQLGMTSGSSGLFRCDESRLTIGVCRHPSSASYAVPTAPFPDQGP